MEGSSLPKKPTSHAAVFTMEYTIGSLPISQRHAAQNLAGFCAKLCGRTVHDPETSNVRDCERRPFLDETG